MRSGEDSPTKVSKFWQVLQVYLFCIVCGSRQHASPRVLVSVLPACCAASAAGCGGWAIAVAIMRTGAWGASS